MLLLGIEPKAIKQNHIQLNMNRTITSLIKQLRKLPNKIKFLVTIFKNKIIKLPQLSTWDKIILRFFFVNSHQLKSPNKIQIEEILLEKLRIYYHKVELLITKLLA